MVVSAPNLKVSLVIIALQLVLMMTALLGGFSHINKRRLMLLQLEDVFEVARNSR